MTDHGEGVSKLLPRSKQRTILAFAQSTLENGAKTRVKMGAEGPTYKLYIKLYI